MSKREPISETEYEFLRSCAKFLTAEEAAQILNRNKRNINTVVNKKGLYFGFTRRRAGKEVTVIKRWTDDERKAIIAMSEFMTHEKIAERVGRTKKSVDAEITRIKDSLKIKDFFDPMTNKSLAKDLGMNLPTFEKYKQRVKATWLTISDHRPPCFEELEELVMAFLNNPDSRSTVSRKQVLEDLEVFRDSLPKTKGIK